MAPGTVRWFDASPTYVLHFSNAYEEGDEVVLEGFHQGAPIPKRLEGETAIDAFRKSLDMHELKTRLHRWRFNLVTGQTHEEFLDDEVSEFPTIDNRVGGRKHRKVIAMTGEPGHFLFNGMVAYDVERGTKQSYRFPEGVFASESPIAPRTGARGEADGYVVTFVSDMRTGRQRVPALRRGGHRPRPHRARPAAPPDLQRHARHVGVRGGPREARRAVARALGSKGQARRFSEPTCYVDPNWLSREIM